jgi:hypothetical protein
MRFTDLSKAGHVVVVVISAAAAITIYVKHNNNSTHGTMQLLSGLKTDSF